MVLASLGFENVARDGQDSRRLFLRTGVPGFIRKNLELIRRIHLIPAFKEID
jgi:hypothetical protein